MTTLQPNTTYHIFNHANGFENVFLNAENYRFFLEKYVKYIDPIAETYAYCLMPNHFHLLVRMRKKEEIITLINRSSNRNDNSSSKVQNFGRAKKDDNGEIEFYLSKQFANLFSSYCQAFNKVNHRMGSLFVKNFKRKEVDSREYFLNLLVYIHQNPVHHMFCNKSSDWPYSSYNEITSQTKNIAEFDKVLKMTGGMDQFVALSSDSASFEAFDV